MNAIYWLALFLGFCVVLVLADRHGPRGGARLDSRPPYLAKTPTDPFGADPEYQVPESWRRASRGLVDPTAQPTEKENHVMDTIEVYQSETDGQFYWRRKAPNGKVICTGEGHTRKRDAFRAAKRALDSNWTFDRNTLRDEDR